MIFQGRIQDFKLGGGGGGGGGGRTYKNCAERREVRNLFGVFRMKNHDFTQKIIFFPILGPPPPPGSALVFDS